MIEPESSVLLLAIIFGVVAIGIWMEAQRRFAEYGVLFIILFSTLLSALSIIPRSAPVYGIIISYLVPMALPMLLFKANLVKIWRESGRVFFAFVLAAFATAACTVTGLFLFDLGPQEGELGGAISAGFIGGGVNTAAVAEAYGLTDDPMMGVALAASYMIVIPFLAFIVLLPAMKRLWSLFSPVETDEVVLGQSGSSVEDKEVPTAFSICVSICLAFFIVAVSDGVANLFGFAPLKYLTITILSVAFATGFPKRAALLHGHYDLGRITIYSFFAVIGAGINFNLALQSGLSFAGFAAFVMFGSLVIISLLGRTFKLNGPELIIACNACILGPPTAAAMAISKGWHNLVTPALLVGVFGYVIGTFFGITIANWF